MSFQRGDACNLPSDLGQFGCVLASNLLCRLPNPYKFLDRLPSLVAPEGILVITGPYTWMEKFTPKVHACYKFASCVYLAFMYKFIERAVSATPLFLFTYGDKIN